MGERRNKRKIALADFIALLVHGIASLNVYSEQHQFLPGLRKLGQTDSFLHGLSEII